MTVARMVYHNIRRTDRFAFFHSFGVRLLVAISKAGEFFAIIIYLSCFLFPRQMELDLIYLDHPSYVTAFFEEQNDNGDKVTWE